MAPLQSEAIASVKAHGVAATPRSNLVRTLRRKGFDRVPIDLSLCPSQVKAFRERFGHQDYETFFGISHRGLPGIFDAGFTDGRALFSRESLPEEITFDGWGVGHSKGSAAAVHMTRMHHPLKGISSVEEIQRYPAPMLSEKKVGEAARRVVEMHANGFAAVAPMACTIWETAWYVRSMEDLMVDMMTGDEKATALFDRVTAKACENAAAFARAGADILWMGDDIGTQRGIMFSVELWSDWLRPRLAAVIAAARAVNPDVLVVYHSCGHITPFIDGLIEIGVDILNPIQPECMNFDEIHDTYGERVSLWGAVGTQQLLPFGSPKQVKEACRHMLEKCGNKGGMVLGPTHLVEPEVPWENLLALRDAAAEFSL